MYRSPHSCWCSDRFNGRLYACPFRCPRSGMLIEEAVDMMEEVLSSIMGVPVTLGVLVTKTECATNLELSMMMPPIVTTFLRMVREGGAPP